MRLMLAIALCASVALADDSAFPDAVLRWGYPGYTGTDSSNMIVLNAGHSNYDLTSIASNRPASALYYEASSKSVVFSNANGAGDTSCSFHKIVRSPAMELQEYSFGMWVYWHALANNYAAIVCKLANGDAFSGGGGGNTSLFFGMNPDNKMRLVVRDTADRELLGPSALPVTTWVFMAGSVRRTGSATLYLNGVGIATNASLFTPPLTYNTATNYDYTIGVYTRSGGNPYNFGGKVASFSYVPRGLSDAEQMQLYLETPHP